MKKRSGNPEKGIALIAAVLAVVVLLAIGLSFAFNMRLEEKAAVNYMSSLQARYVAEAGIEEAVARLKNDADPSGSYSYAATEHDQFGDVWDFSSSVGYIDLGKGVIGNYTVTVVDTDRRIYLNDFNLTNVQLGTLLQDLVDLLIADTTETEFASGGPPSGDNTDGTLIGTNRPVQTDGGYITKRQIVVVDGSTISAAAEYATLNNYVTSEGYFNANRFGGRSAININTADQRVLEAVIGAMGVSSSDRDTIVLAILEYRSGYEYDTDPDAGETDEKWEKTTTPVSGTVGNDNPFDGIDTNSNDGIDPTVSGFDTDTLDNDGDGVPDETEADENLDYDGDGDMDLTKVEPFMFAGGARGEFNALIDYLTTSNYGSGSGTISSPTATTVKNDADTANTPTTVGLDFESKFFEITSTGRVGMDSNSDTVIDELYAESVIVRIVERER